ncbi:MAG TPA: histidine kinase [Telluria sp.]|nr:histidine kinase [Telluria sp.]
MTAPAPDSGTGQGTADAEARLRELEELLGFVSTSWDDERRLLARKLHDNLGSSLTALTMHLTLLTQRLPPDKPLQDRVAQMKQLLLQVVNTNRQMQLALWNDKLEFLGVKAAIAEHVAEFNTAHAGLQAAASLPEGEVACSREQGVALLRCVEEGLANAAAHAGARLVDVVLDDNEDELTLTVRDDGNGQAKVGDGAPDCHGLRLLRERVRFLGGEFSAGPAPGGPGSCLRASFARSA